MSSFIILHQRYYLRKKYIKKENDFGQLWRVRNLQWHLEVQTHIYLSLRKVATLMLLDKTAKKQFLSYFSNILLFSPFCIKQNGDFFIKI